MPVAADCPSETSSPICKSFDKLSHSPDSGNKDEGKTSSSDSRTNHATAGTKTSKVKGSRHFWCNAKFHTSISIRNSSCCKQG